MDGKVDRLRMDVMARLDRHETKLTSIHDDFTLATRVGALDGKTAGDAAE